MHNAIEYLRQHRSRKEKGALEEAWEAARELWQAEPDYNRAAVHLLAGYTQLRSRAMLAILEQALATEPGEPTE
jgi:predicted metal-dependent hydrolase